MKKTRNKEIDFSNRQNMLSVLNIEINMHSLIRNQYSYFLRRIFSAEFFSENMIISALSRKECYVLHAVGFAYY